MTMLITFGQYNTLIATRRPVTRDEVAEQLTFDHSMVSYYISVLQNNGMIQGYANGTDRARLYRLTEAGEACLEEYERSNPELIVNRVINQV